MRTVSPAAGMRWGDQLAGSLQFPEPFRVQEIVPPPPLGAAVTRTMASSSTPSLVARTVVTPGDTPVTTPEDELTVAQAQFAVVHVTDRPVSTFPFASKSCAVYVRV